MKWKEEVIEKLRAMEPMRMALMNLPQEIKRLEEEYAAVKTQSLSGKYVVGEPRSREDKQIDNIVCRQELQWSLERVRVWMESMLAAMSVLTKEERIILQEMYVYPTAGVMDRLCEQMGLEKSSIYRKRDRALRKLTLAMYGAMESN